MTVTAERLTPQEVARLYRDVVVRDKSYQLLPLGGEAGDYLRAKRKRLTVSSYRDYEGCLDKFARHFAYLESVTDLEPPVGTERVEEFLEETWGKAEPRTYNKNHSILKDFFKYQRVRGRMQGDPMLAIDRARSRDVHREVFTSDQRRAIVAEQESLRDRIALRLLLDYGIRKGALQAIQFKHFDHWRKRLTIFTKGEKVRTLPIPDPEFWLELEQHIMEVDAKPQHYLMARESGNQRSRRRHPKEPMAAHGVHKWWYRCLTRAGIVPQGTTKGEHMHKARHTAGQRVLDATGNLKAVQKLLGHSSIKTTADSYVDWDVDQLAATLADVLRDEKR